jgi:hypothetical protein
MAEPQIDKVLEQMPAYPPGPDERNQPRVMIPSALKITREQEDRLLEWAEARVKTLEGELGRDQISDAYWFSADPTRAKDAGQTFMGRRQIYEMSFANQVEWREQILGSIFEVSNYTVPISRRIAQQQISRAISFFLGTDPWFTVSPVGEMDEERSEKANQFARYKLRKAKLKKTLERAIYGAFIRGESVVKTVHVDKSVTYTTEAVVAVADGEPIIAADGDFIFQDDEAIEIEPPIPEGENPEEFVPLRVLARDSVTPMPSPDQFELREIERTITHYRGPSSEVVYYRDFLAPLNAPDLQDCDVCAHLYDMPVMSLVDMVTQKGDFSGDISEQYEAGLKMIREIANESGAPSTKAMNPRPELNERFTTSEGESSESTGFEPTTEIAEVYLRFDVDEDGRYEDILLVYDRKNDVPLFYDHVANVTPDGKRPFRVVRINPVEGRWHGIGSMEIFEPIQKICDLAFNRWNFSQSQSGRVDLWRPYNTFEGQSNPNLEMNYGHAYTPLPDKTKDDILESIYLEDIKSDEQQKIIEFNLQLAMNMSGIASANDSQMAGLDSTKLATGIRNIDRSGQELFGVYLSDLEEGFEEVTSLNITVTLANLEEAELFEYFEGDVAQIDTMSPGEITHLDLNLRLEMTRYKAEQQMHQSTFAIEAVEKFYSYPPNLQSVVAPFFRNLLKVYEVKNADAFIVPGIQAMPPMSGMPQGDPAAIGQSQPEAPPNRF